MQYCGVIIEGDCGEKEIPSEPGRLEDWKTETLNTYELWQQTAPPEESVSNTTTAIIKSAVTEAAAAQQREKYIQETENKTYKCKQEVEVSWMLVPVHS